MRVLLAVCAASLVAGDSVNVNFNTCTGSTSGENACGIKQLVRYVETEFPPFDDIDEHNHQMTGLIPHIFAEICKTDVMNGIECVEIRDSWNKIWTPDHYPGEALSDGWYHMAFAFKNTLRKQSNLYSYPISRRVANHFMFRQDNPRVTDAHKLAFPAGGNGLRICAVESWGDLHALQETFPLATYELTADVKEQFEVLNNTKTETGKWCDLVFTSVDEWNTRNAESPGVFAVFNEHGENGISILELNPNPRHEDNVAFMFSRKNKCIRDLVNKALIEMAKDTDKIKKIFDKAPILEPRYSTWRSDFDLED